MTGIMFKLLALALSLQKTVVLAGKIQTDQITLPADAQDYRNAVQSIFTDTYGAYRKYAWGHDDLAVISKSFTDSRNGWGATIVDSMGTMLVMGLTDLYNEALNFTGSIDFSKSQTPDNVSVFETTIRYLGGFLSAYELNSKLNGKTDDILIQKAKEVADKMAFAWINGNEWPYNIIDFSTNQPEIGGSGIAVAGTLAMEWATLSKYTSNDTYRALGEGSLKKIATTPTTVPGLAPQGIDPATGRFTNSFISWGGGSDSYFEYLLKLPLLTGTTDSTYIDTWKLAVDSSIRFLLKRSTVGNHLYLAQANNDKLDYVSSHLACFHGGNWIQGGRLLDNQTIMNFGLELADACWNTYASTTTGIGPEGFAFMSAEGGGPPPADQLDFFNQHGYWITSGAYILRPEVLESQFIAWRATGDTKYYDRGKAAVDSFMKYLKVDEGYSGISNVMQTNSPRFDSTESFFYAEVLKYLYLMFDDPSHISLDEWAFNTECHPLISAGLAGSTSPSPSNVPQGSSSGKGSTGPSGSTSGTATLGLDVSSPTPTRQGASSRQAIPQTLVASLGAGLFALIFFAL